MAYTDRDRIKELERRVSELHAETARRYVRLGKTPLSDPKTATMLYGRPRATVTPGIAEFEADVTEIVFGVEADSIVTVKNVYAESFTSEHILPLWKSDADGKYRIDREGEGDALIRIELVADKSRASTTGTAKPISVGGGSLGPNITVVDLEAKFQGFGPYVRPQDNTAQPGYRGYCLLVDGAYVLVTLEGSARFVEGVAAEESVSGAGRATVVNYWGAWPNNREPEVYARQYGAGTSQDPTVTKYVLDWIDPTGIAGGQVPEGAKLLLVWDEERSTYVLLNLAGAAAKRVRGTVTQTITRTDTEATITGVKGLDIAADLPDITIQILDHLKMEVPNGSIVYAVRNVLVGTEWATQWDNADFGNNLWVLHGHTNWDASKIQVLSSQGSSAAQIQWIEVQPKNYVSTVKTITPSFPGAATIKIDLVSTEQPGLMLVQTPPGAPTDKTITGSAAGKVCGSAP